MVIRRLYHILLPPGTCIPVTFQLAELDIYPTKLAYEGRKAKRIIASRDISYSFTNVMANNYYSLRKNPFPGRQTMYSVDIPHVGSYDHFCFFDHIQQSKKKKDSFAFFIFFTFKSKTTSISFVIISHPLL
jgi:hypothetical protein